MTLNVDTIFTASVADEQHALADEATNGVFGALAESTRGHVDRNSWEAHVRTIEDEFMERTCKSKPDAMTKGRGNPGSRNYVAPRWKYAKYLPKSWSSSKSVCGQAIDHGIAIDENSGKTATENKIKELKSSLKSDKTPQEKFAIAMDTAKKVLKDIPDDEWGDLFNDYGIDNGNSFWTGA